MPPWIICRIPFFKCSGNLHKFPVFAHLSVVSFSTSTPKISIFDYLVNHQQFSPECAANVSSSASTEFLNKPQNADSVLNFLKENGFSKNQIEAIVRKAPKFLCSNVETSIKPKMQVFQDLGFQSTDFSNIISTNPWLLSSSADRLKLFILGLKNVLGPNADICRLLKNSGSRRVVAYDLNRTLVPNIEYLKSCGVCFLQFPTQICGNPTTFFNKPEKLRDIVKRVDEMGVDRKSKMFIETVRVMNSMSRDNWELKLKLFRDLGFSEQNILYTFRVYPGAFTISERKIKEVTQLLLSFVDISYISAHPRLLSYSVEKKLKPRLQVLKALESKNLLKKRPALAAFCQISNAKFMDRYVIPYSDELGDLYVASQQVLMKHS